MDDAADKPRVAWEGPRARIVFSHLASGKHAADKFYDSLNDSDRRKFHGLFDRMCSYGVIRDDQKFPHEQGNIYAFKIHRQRIYCFRDGQDWILTNGCVKKRDKANPRQLERAENIQAMHVAAKRNRGKK